ncbi:MAG: hypothetical protein AAFN78_03010 [Pseudomonadota bacterium]
MPDIARAEAPGKVQTSAPGKLVLTGEYAVLDGAPAVSMAVDAQATVRLATAARYRLTAPGLLTSPVEFSPGDSTTLRWPGVDAATRRQLALFESIAAPLLARHDHAPFEAELDTRAFFSDGTKLGFGSSAALATSLAAALERYLNLPTQTPAERLAALLAQHRGVQGGRGSGIDLATALHGGVIEYTLDTTGATVRPVELPANIHWLCVWSGAATSTGDFLARLAAWRTAEPAAAGAQMASLADGARVAAAALTDGTRFLRAVRDYGAALDALGKAAGIDVVSRAHRRVAAIAAKHGAVYKPSGAGGGDVGIAFANDAEVLERLREALVAAGLHCPAVSLCREGLTIAESIAE